MNIDSAMKKIIKILILIIIDIALLILTGHAIFNYFYYKEKNTIAAELEKLPGVRVIKIWGHHDVKLEEVSALIEIENKGKLIITNLNKHDYSYPNHVYIPYIGGYTFKTFGCKNTMSIGSGISIGKNDLLGKRIGLAFKSHIDVINQYDSILNFVKSFPQYPTPAHFIDDEDELFVIVKKDYEINTNDPLYNLCSIEDDVEFAKTLNWSNKKCIR